MTKNPILIIALNYVTAWLVAQGYLNPESHDAFVDGLSNTVGIVIALITSIFSLHHIASSRKNDHELEKIKHPINNPGQTGNGERVDNDSDGGKSYTQPPVIVDGGTPPSTK